MLVKSLRPNVVLSFLAGMCRDNEDHSHCCQKLVKQLDDCIGCSVISGVLLMFVHCVYECPSIMQSVNNKNSVGGNCLEPRVGFDWYVTGYCISHFNIEWGLSTIFARDEEDIDLLVKGFRSSSTGIGKIQKLIIQYSSCKSLSQLKEVCQLHTLTVGHVSITDEDDDVSLCQLIEHQSRLRRVMCSMSGKINYNGTGSFIPLLLGLPSLEELELHSYRININTELLPHSNTKLKELTIASELIQPLATLLPNMTSLTYLNIVGTVTDSDISVLITTVQSLHMLEVLHLVYISLEQRDDMLDLSELVLAAGNSQLKELILDSHYYGNLPQHIRGHYNHLLRCPYQMLK